MITLLGYIGSVLLALCGVPLLFPNKRFGGRAFLHFWFWGELALPCYVSLLGTAPAILFDPLFLNYGFNTLLVGYLLRRGDGAH